MSTFLPTVLLVDDDPAMNDYLRERFHDETSIGAVCARTLSQAKELIDTKQLSISAVVADVFFDEGKADPKHHLGDGLDLLQYCSEVRPDLPQYVFSVFSERDAERDKAKDLNLPIRFWFQKAWMRPGQGGASAPWASVERDLIEESIRKEDGSLRQRLLELKCSGEEVTTTALSEAIRSLKIPRRTYLQSINDSNYNIIHPIEVLCTVEDDGTVRAHASRFALINDGFGTTVDEALSSLGDSLLNILETLDKEPDQDLHDYLRQYRDSLHQHIREVRGI